MSHTGGGRAVVSNNQAGLDVNYLLVLIHFQAPSCGSLATVLINMADYAGT